MEWTDRGLSGLEDWLKERPYLTGEEFTVADLLMTTVLREVRHGGVLERYPGVIAYRERCEARPPGSGPWTPTSSGSAWPRAARARSDEVQPLTHAAVLVTL